MGANKFLFVHYIIKVDIKYIKYILCTIYIISILKYMKYI